VKCSFWSRGSRTKTEMRKHGRRRGKYGKISAVGLREGGDRKNPPPETERTQKKEKHGIPRDKTCHKKRKKKERTKID